MTARRRLVVLPFLLIVSLLLKSSEAKGTLATSTVSTAQNDAEEAPEAPHKEAEESLIEATCAYELGCKKLSPVLLEALEQDGILEGLAERNKIKDPLLYFTKPTKLPLSADKRKVPYVGVMLDAGSHYFEMDWIQNLLQIMYALGLNLLHFRLTGDEAFNVQLDSQPSLAHAALNADGKVYSKQDLHVLVEFASSLNISIVPEITIPVHAAAWAGNITNIIVPCANFICSQGRGLPLNLAHPRIYAIIKDALKEVHEIFIESPYIHLGGLGGEHKKAQSECFRQAAMEPFDYDQFEVELKRILKDLDLPESKIIRLEPNDVSSTRAGNVLHNFDSWNSKAQQAANNDSSSICSYHMSMDTDGVASNIFRSTRDCFSKGNPTAIIVPTLRLSAEFWLDRNVVGRLIAVSMASAGEDFNDSKYQEYCLDYLKFDAVLCRASGALLIRRPTYTAEMTELQLKVRNMLCQRLASQSSRKVLRENPEESITLRQKAMQHFWNEFGETKKFATDPLPRLEPKVDGLSTHGPLMAGIVLDLVQIYDPSRVISILELMHHLGLNTLQLRIMSKLGFALEIPKLPELCWTEDETYTVHSFESIEKLVQKAGSLGIQIIPEIAVSTNAAGWFRTDALVSCPETYCHDGGIAVNVTNTNLLGIVTSTLLHLLDIFQPPFIHLGFDEREHAKACYEEAQLSGMDADLNEWERRLTDTLEFQDVQMDKLIRWDNSEHFVYPHRTGLITNYRYSEPPANTAEPYFVSMDLLNGTDAWSMYETTRQLAEKTPMGLLGMIDNVDEWSDLEAKVLAFSIALSPTDSYTQVEFEKRWSLLAESLPEVEKNKHANVALRLSDRPATCEMLVDEHVVKILPRLGVLVDAAVLQG